MNIPSSKLGTSLFAFFGGVIGALPYGVQGLLLDLCSGVTPEYAQGTLYGARD